MWLDCNRCISLLSGKQDKHRCDIASPSRGPDVVHVLAQTPLPNGRWGYCNLICRELKPLKQIKMCGHQRRPRDTSGSAPQMRAFLSSHSQVARDGVKPLTSESISVNARSFQIHKGMLTTAAGKRSRKEGHTSTPLWWRREVSRLGGCVQLSLVLHVPVMCWVSGVFWWNHVDSAGLWKENY